MSPRGKAGRAVPYLALLCLLGCTIALLAVSALAYSDLKAQLDSISLHGNSARFTRSFHERLVVLLRLASAVPILAAGVVYLNRQRVAEYASYFFASLVGFGSCLAYGLRAALRVEERLHLLALGLTLAVAAAVRVMFLFQPMRYDEAYTFTHYASTPFYLALSNYSAPNNHLFHTLLVRVSYLLFGDQPWALRLPVLVAGVLVVAASYLLARILYNKQTALLAAGLVASSSALIEFSTNARGYGLVCLFFLLTLTLATYLVRSESVAAWTLLSVLSALGFYTVPTMLYPFGIVVLWLFLHLLESKSPLDRSRTLRKLLVTVATTAALTLSLYSPVLLVSGPVSIAGNEYVAPKSWTYVLQALPASAWSTWVSWSQGLPDMAGAALVGGFVVSLAFHRRLSAYRVPTLALAAAVIVPTVLVQRVVPYGRVWLFLLPLYLISASAGLTYIWNQLPVGYGGRKAAVLTLLTIGLSAGLAYNVVSTQSVYWSEDTGTLRDAEAITIWMKENLRAGDKVLVASPADGPLEYYFRVQNMPASQYWYSARTSGGSAEPIQRIVAVVKEPGQSVESLLRKAGVTDSRPDTPLLQRFEGAALYEVMLGSDPK